MFPKLLFGTILLLVGGYFKEADASSCSMASGFVKQFQQLAWRDIGHINSVLRGDACRSINLSSSDQRELFPSKLTGVFEGHPLLYIHFGTWWESDFKRKFQQRKNNPSGLQNVFACASAKMLSNAFSASYSGTRKLDVIVNLDHIDVDWRCCSDCDRVPQNVWGNSVVGRLFFVKGSMFFSKRSGSTFEHKTSGGSVIVNRLTFSSDRQKLFSYIPKNELPSELRGPF